MTTRKKYTTLAVVLVVALAAIRAVAQQPGHGPNPSQGKPMMGKGPGMMDMNHDSETNAIHELVVNHDRIKRTVTNLSDGIRTVTESGDPGIAKLIKEHVASMDQRVSTQSDPGLSIESHALRTILRNGDKVKTTLETTASGAIVTQTSEDPETVRALQEHAAEVTDLVQRGMVAVHEAMMRNGGMRGLMMSRTEPQAPDHGVAMPAGMTHEEHMTQMKKEAEMKQHGNAAMGFDQDRTTHHFLMTSDGGSIAADANDPADQESITQIRTHLKEIAIAFKQGDFGKPYETHSEYPAGVPAMQRLKGHITYAYAETPRGGIIRIGTANAEALTAIHAFLAYQVKEHATGDPLTPDNHAAHGFEIQGQTATGTAQPDHFAHRFDNPSEYADRFDDPKRDEWQMPERVIATLGLKPGQSVADIGAGTGYFTIRLAKSAAKPVVYAVDIEPAMVEYTLGRATQERLDNVIGVKADADRANLPAPVDVVLIVDTFHHLPNRVAYFRGLKQQLKPGARLAIIDWRNDSPEGPPVEFRYSPEQISAELAEAGFALAQSHDFLPRQHFLVFQAR